MRVAFGLALSVLGLQLITHATHAQNYPPAPPPPPLVSEPPPAAAASQPAPPPSYPTPQRFEPAAVERPERAPQPEPKRTAFNALYVELLGNAGVYSLNYERFVTDDVSIRGGLMYVSLGVRERGEREQAKATVLFVPLMVYYLGVGNADHKLDLGLGFLFIYASAAVSGVGNNADAKGVGIGGTATFGYRYAPHDGGFHFKVGFTPIFGIGGFLPWPGISFGAIF